MSLSIVEKSINNRKYILLLDKKTSSNSGGTFNSGAWRTRVLNTIEHDETSSVTLSSNQFTLPAGTYECIAGGVSNGVGNQRVRIYNTTDSSTAIQGENSSFSAEHSAVCLGRFTIASSKTFELQHYCDNSVSDTGFGASGVGGGNEIYAWVQLYKVETVNVLEFSCS